MASNIANTVIPNQMNLQKTADSFDSNRQSIGMVTSALTAFVNNLKKYNATVGNLDINKTSKTFMSALNIYVDTVKKLQDVEIKALKKMPSEKTFQNITSTFKNIMDAMKKGFADMADSLGKDDSYTKLMKLLTPQKEVTEVKNTNQLGVGTVETTTKESGTIMDSLNMILNVYSQLGNMEKTGPLKGLIKGKMIVKRFKNQVLDTFINIFDLCIKEFEKYDVNKVQNIYESVKSVDKITVVLCQLLQKLSEPAVIVGSQKRVLLKGFNLLIGSPEEENVEGGGWICALQEKIGKHSAKKAKHHNLMAVVGTVFSKFVEINTKYGRAAHKAFRNINDLTESLIKITTSFALLGLLAIPAIIGMKVLVGGSILGIEFNGILGGLITMMERLAQAKDVQVASKNLLLISGAVMLLSGAVTLMALTGAMLITNWVNVGITVVGTLILVALVGFLGSKVFKKNIEGGTKSLLMLSGTILLLSLTAVALVTTGQFLIASWDSIGQTALLIAVLAGAMWLLSFMKNTFEQSAKSMLILVMTVGLLGLIAVGLVWISNYIGGNWVSVLLIIGIMAVLAGAMWLVGQIGSNIDIAGLLVVSFGALLLSFTMLVLTKAAQNLNTFGGALAFLLVVIGMVAIVVAVAGLFTAVGTLASQPLFWVGVAAMALIIGFVLSFAHFVNSLASSVKTIAETAKMIKDEKWGEGKTMYDYLMQPVSAMIAICAALKDDKNVTISAKMKFRRLSKIAGYIGNMAMVLKDIASLNIPIYDNNGKIIGYKQMDQSDFTNAATNAGAIAKTLIGMFDREKEITVMGGKKIKIGILDDLDNGAVIMPRHKRRMRRLAKITSFIGNMAQTLQDLASMRYPVEFDKDGKPISWKPMDNQIFGQAAENAGTIAKTLVGMFSDKTFKDTLKTIDEDNAEVLGIVLNSVGNLSNVLSVVATLASGKIPLSTEERDGKMVVTQTIEVSEIMKQSSTVSDNIKELVMCVVRGVVGIDEDMLDDAEDMVKDLNKVVESAVNSTTNIISLYKDNLKDLDVDDLNKKYEGTHKTLSGLVGFFEGKKFTNSNASAFTKQVTSLTNVLKQVDKTDLNKLKYAYSLVSKLADFAKSIRGDFDKLAECISEDLIEAIEKLNATFEGTSNNLNSISTTSTADFTPSKSGTDAEAKSSSADNKNIGKLQAQIETLQRELDSYKQQMKMPRIKTDPSTGAVVVKMLN